MDLRPLELELPAQCLQTNLSLSPCQYCRDDLPEIRFLSVAVRYIVSTRAATAYASHVLSQISTKGLMPSIFSSRVEFSSKLRAFTSLHSTLKSSNVRPGVHAPSSGASQNSQSKKLWSKWGSLKREETLSDLAQRESDGYQEPKTLEQTLQDHIVLSTHHDGSRPNLLNRVPGKWCV